MADETKEEIKDDKKDFYENMEDLFDASKIKDLFVNHETHEIEEVLIQLMMSGTSSSKVDVKTNKLKELFKYFRNDSEEIKNISGEGIIGGSMGIDELKRYITNKIHNILPKY